MSIRDKIKEYIRELVRRELEEASVTGNLDGGAGPPKTPYMFQSKPKSKKDKEKEKKIAQAAPPFDKITGADFKKLRATGSRKPKQ